MPKSKTISAEVSVPGSAAHPKFRLVENGADSFNLYRGARKIGTARVEENQSVSARFEGLGKSWSAEADDAPDLLNLVGTFLLAHEVRDEAPSGFDVEETGAGISAAERKLVGQWKALSGKRRNKDLDDLIAAARKRIKPRKS